MTPIEQKLTVWLTGASSGIGLALLKQLVAKGHTVVATARSVDSLEKLREEHGEQVIPLVADTTAPEHMARCAESLARIPVIDWAILNAGTCEYLDVQQFSAELIDRVMTTNVVGTARCVEAVLPRLRAARNRGRQPRLAIVSSSAWWFPFTRAEAYGASKAALSYFGQSLRADLHYEGIAVSVISPGFVETPLTARNDFSMPFIIPAEEAARIIVKGLEKGRSEIAFPKKFTVTLRLLGLLPGLLRDKLAASLSRNTSENQA
ncbi:SDR family NAD(P)-dependent oxidoreductase [Marinobacteraceae bacterium S3BR75-40.1]